MKDTERSHDIKLDLLNKKISGLLKEIASISKTKRTANIAKDSGGSGTDSPITN